MCIIFMLASICLIYMPRSGDKPMFDEFVFDLLVEKKSPRFIFMLAKAIFSIFADKPTFEACRIAYEPTPTVNSGKACQLSEDIVSVSCLPDSWAACEELTLYFASLVKTTRNINAATRPHLRFLSKTFLICFSCDIYILG
jgi:hypothetical protein